MHTNRMQKAADACAKAGIGLTAMKTQGGRSARSPAPELMEKELDLLSKASENFLEKGFTDNQARLIAVWKNPHIASICSRMPNMTILKANMDAALNRTKLSRHDLAPLQRYASMTASGYCAGCASICESAVEGTIPIASVMRYLMYLRSYGDRDRARALFNNLPRNERRRIVATDYTAAEQKCPHRMAIGRLMAEAVQEFA
jgi:predicted aldo/keto reductase-like oxidoreductase